MVIIRILYSFVFPEALSPQVVIVIDPAAPPVRMAFDAEVIVRASGQVALPSSGFQ
jgi:hypothetical protein